MELHERWFDDYTVGEIFEVGDHEMTEERIMSFATEFDPQRFHVDREAAAASIYGGVIASGWHSAAVLMKLLSSTLGESSQGSPGCDELRWVAPVRPGDRLKLRVEVMASRVSGSDPTRGILRYRNELLNQRDETVLSLYSTMFMSRQKQVSLDDGDR